MTIPHAAMFWMTIIIFTRKKDVPNYIDILSMRLKIDVPCGVGKKAKGISINTVDRFVVRLSIPCKYVSILYKEHPMCKILLVF